LKKSYNTSREDGFSGKIDLSVLVKYCTDPTKNRTDWESVQTALEKLEKEKIPIVDPKILVKKRTADTITENLT
jgi:hypothetical protein